MVMIGHDVNHAIANIPHTWKSELGEPQASLYNQYCNFGVFRV